MRTTESKGRGAPRSSPADAWKWLRQELLPGTAKEPRAHKAEPYPPCVLVLQWRPPSNGITGPSPGEVLRKLLEIQSPPRSSATTEQKPTRIVKRRFEGQILPHFSASVGGRAPDWVFRGMQRAEYPLLANSRRNQYPFSDVLRDLVSKQLRATSVFRQSRGGGAASELERIKRCLERRGRGFRPSMLGSNLAVRERFCHLHCAAEFQVVRDFADVANDAGLLLFDELGTIPEGEASLVAGEDDWVPCMSTALAQHHGIATKLLDWSRRVKIAAYFSALPPKGDLDRDAEGNMAIWALNAGALASPVLGDERDQSLVRTFRCNHAQHPYLHAQDGLFTWIDEAFQRLWLRERGSWPSVPDALGRDGFGDETVAIKVVFPRSVARDLRNLLRAERISYSTMMPAHDSVSKSLQAFWADRAHEGDLLRS